MSHDPILLEKLAGELEAIRLSAFWMEREHEAALASLNEASRQSARNLLHYMALRRRDLRPLQEELAVLGLSSLGRAESHVTGNLEAVLAVLYRLLGQAFQPSADGVRAIGHEEGRRRLRSRADALFGESPPRADGRQQSRILVTMPADAAVDSALVRDLVDSGMTCMRINCAHDDRAAWARMVEHLERARRETGKDCRLLMDLAGPKLRTGAIEPGPRLIHWQPKRDEAGRVEEPARLWLTPQESPEIAAVEPKVDAVLPLPRAWLDRLRAGDSIRYRDVRGKSGAAAVVERLGSSWLAESTSLTYLGTECSLRVKRRGLKRGDASLPEDILPTGILPLSQSIRLFPGETLRLTRDPEPARPDQRDAGGRLLEEPRIACTLPEVFAFVRPGERACFDDGKIGAVVLSSSPEELRLEITHPFEGKKLRADKGINFPDSKFTLPALTAKDLEDLDFIVQHADMVGLSFINRPEDVEDLDRELARRTTRKLGRVLKIETRRAFEQLPRIILRALRDDRVGVMIARGDLAVECGYERLAELQEEILWICEAAHVPVIWATQVLETLNKKGLPSRAEVTDAAMGERAECVMLNKGPHVVETVKMLGDILARMQGHQEKKTPMLRALGISGMREGG